MAYNLIEERWIPVRRQSGKVERIAPWQIADRTDPPVTIESSRPDFDAALLEMLIGLVQTVMTPKDESEWADRYESGVALKDLHTRMKSVSHAFDLDGDGPRFFQDLDVHEHPKAKREPIVKLLIDQTVQEAKADAALFANQAHFAQLGLPMAAAAILTMQQFAGEGGPGHRTSLRGGGPLSVTLQDSTLWGTVWCNVLSKADLGHLPGDSRKTAPEHTFPWLTKTRTSEGANAATVPESMHPLQHFWGLPRRYRLCLDDLETGSCAISGDTGLVVKEMISRNYGTNYKGPFLHPLTPYSIDDPAEPPRPKKGGSGVSYRDWALLHLGGEDLVPPRAVEAFYRNERWRVAKVSRVATRGYAMESAKPLGFFETLTPIVIVTAGLLEEMRVAVSELTLASDEARQALASSALRAVRENVNDLSGDAKRKLAEQIRLRTDAAFWSVTEAAFYRALTGIASALARSSEHGTERIRLKTDYIKALQGGALAVFDGLCPADAELGAEDLGRVIRARRSLERLTHPEALAPLVGLAEPAPPMKKTSRKKSDDTSPKAGRKGRAS